MCVCVCVRERERENEGGDIKRENINNSTVLSNEGVREKAGLKDAFHLYFKKPSLTTVFFLQNVLKREFS